MITKNTIDNNLYFYRHDYLKAKHRYEDVLNELKAKEEHQKKNSEILNTYKHGLKKLESINLQLIESDTEHKRQLFGSIFPEMFQFKKTKFEPKILTL